MKTNGKKWCQKCYCMRAVTITLIPSHIHKKWTMLAVKSSIMPSVWLFLYTSVMEMKFAIILV